MPARKRPADSARSEKWMRTAVNQYPEYLNAGIASAFHWKDRETLICAPRSPPRVTTSITTKLPTGFDLMAAVCFRRALASILPFWDEGAKVRNC